MATLTEDIELSARVSRSVEISGSDVDLSVGDTTGTILALPPVFGQNPAAAEKSCLSCVDPLEGIAAKAKRLTAVGLAPAPVGRPTAHMMALPAVVPLDETDVKNPGSCPEPIDAVASCVSVGEADICTCHVRKVEPWLVTTRLTPSDPSKKDGPHQQASVECVSSGGGELVGGEVFVGCPKLAGLSKNTLPSFPAATAR
jgi:hypothetical protein